MEILIIPKNYFSKNLVLGVIASFFCLNLLFAQGSQTNLEKYWHYRYRLVNYFMVVGPDAGESIPADNRNWVSDLTHPPIDYSIMHWGDEPVYLGYYIGVLATEYALLHRNNQNTDQTLTELYYALNALRRLDAGAEQHYPVTHDIFGNTLNGFMNSSDVPEDFVQNHSNKLNYDISNNASTAHSGEIALISQTQASSNSSNLYRDPASQDHLYNILMGLALVKKLVGDNNITFANTLTGNNFTYDFSFASEEALRIVTYMKNLPSIFGAPALMPAPVGSDNIPMVPTNWTLWEPTVIPSLIHSGTLGITNQPNGWDAKPFSTGIAKAGEYFSPNIFFEDNLTTENMPIWQQFQFDRCVRTQSSDLAMPLIIAAIGDSWKLPNGFNEGSISASSFASFLLSGGGFNNSTKDGINYQGDFNSGVCSNGWSWSDNHFGWEQFYGAVHRVLHDYSCWDSPALDLCKIQQILDSAPDEGPFAHSGSDLASDGTSNYAWACSFRFYGNYGDHPSPVSQQIQGNEGFWGNYNGLDYMLMHNLYYLLIQTGPDVVVQNCPEPTGFDGYFRYFVTQPYIHFNPNQPIVYSNSVIYTEPGANTHYGIDLPGSAAIIGGPQGVVLLDVSVLPGAELYVNTLEGCGLADPADYQYLPGSYHSPIINNSSTTNSQNNATASANTLPPYQMTDEFKNDVKEYSISNYPNPYKENTTITFAIKEKANVSITITDVYGKLLLTIINNTPYEKGSYSFNLNNAKLAAGVYYCQLHANEVIKTNKLIVTK